MLWPPTGVSFDCETNKITSWITHRQQLIVIFNKLLEIYPFNNELCDLNKEAQKFCSHLVDYIAAFNFDIVTIFADADKRYKGFNKIIPKSAYILMLRTSITALKFNDKYSQVQNYDKTLKQDLAFLWEELARRFDLEDKMVMQYYLSIKNFGGSTDVNHLNQ